MHRCEHKGCKELVDNNWHFCYEHRNDVYYDICKVHGKQKFILGKCQECQKLRTPIYRIHFRNGRYYSGKSKKPLPENYFLKRFYGVLMCNNKEKYISNISKFAGIYGIFVRTKKGLGKCLYVGQSNCIARRITQHKNNFVIASNHIKGLNLHKRKVTDYKVESKYYKMADNYKLSELKFVSLYKIPTKIYNKYSEEEQKTILTYLEQSFMDYYKPSLNSFDARQSTIN